MYYSCEEHEITWPTKQPAQGHKNTRHRDDPDFELLEHEELVDGYEVREARQGNRSRSSGVQVESKGGAATTEAPTSPSAPEYPDFGDESTNKLAERLTNLSVPPGEVRRICLMYKEYPNFRAEPQQLHTLLTNQIRDKSVHSFIPLVVGSIFQPEEPASATQFYYNPAAPAPGLPAPGIPAYPAPPGPYHFQLHVPNGHSPYSAPAYGPAPQAGPWPPYSNGAEDGGELKRVLEALETKLDSRIDKLVERWDKVEEQRLKDEEQRKVEARFERMEASFSASLDQLRQQLQDGNPKAGNVTDVLDEMRAMRRDMSDAQIASLVEAVEMFGRRIDSVKPEPTGRSTEDLLHEVGPGVVSTIQQAGGTISREMAAFREQSFPRMEAEEAIDEEQLPGASQRPLTPQEILEQVEVENQLLGGPDESPEDGEGQPTISVLQDVPVLNGESPVTEADLEGPDANLLS